MLSQPPPQLTIPDHYMINNHHRTKLSSSFYAVSPLDSPASEEEHMPSPTLNYSYAPRNSTAPFDSSVSPVEIYHNQHPHPPHHFSSASDAPEQQPYDINSSATPNSGPMDSYQLSESPSPVDPQCSISVVLPHSISVAHSQERFLHSDVNPYLAEDRSLPRADSELDHPSHKLQDKYPLPNLQNSLLDQRRMSEPAALGGPTLYATSEADHYPFAYNPPPLHPTRTSLYLSPLHRGASTGSLRDLRHHHFEYPPQQQEWKHDDSRHREQHEYYGHRADILDEPISPMQPTFAHGIAGSPNSGLPYSPISENLYGPSPPGTGTSTSSSVAPLSAGLPCSPSRSISQHLQRSLSASQLSNEPVDRKTYSFVALPGNAVKKRPRRRYDEIERLYLCSWPDCNKSYGTLNHLNAHVTMQKHGPKRSPNEFKELRKQWRKAKKDQEAVSVSMRRDSYSDSYDDHAGYNQRYLLHSLHHRPHSSHHTGMGSVTIGTTERYTVPIEDIRYPPQERDDALDAYDHTTARQRYNNVQPASWHGGSNLTSLRNVQQSYNSPLPTQHARHSQLPQLAINTRLQHSLSDNEPAPAPLNRLPQNSTLLTPLPGYHTPSLIPPLHNGGGSIAYTPQGYEIFEEDNNGRPGTGHASIASMGHASGDDYDHSQ